MKYKKDVSLLKGLIVEYFGEEKYSEEQLNFAWQNCFGTTIENDLEDICEKIESCKRYIDSSIVKNKDFVNFIKSLFDVKMKKIK